MTVTNNAWTTFSQNAQQHPDHTAAAWAAAPQQPQFQQYPPTSAYPQPAAQFRGHPAPIAPANRMPLIIGLIVAAVLLIGGGVTTAVLLSKKGGSATAGGPSGGGAVAVPVASPGTVEPSADAPGLGRPTTGPADAPTADRPTADQPATDAPGTGSGSPVTDPAEPEQGGGDIDTAYRLAQVWVDFINEGDIETASALVCDANRQDFLDGFDAGPAVNQLEITDLVDDGATMALTVGVVGDPSTVIPLTMWPTDTGYFLICEGPLSQADLAW